ncbi:MAG TPA: hypothetical protein VIN03_16675 [Roseateles sp.]
MSRVTTLENLTKPATTQETASESSEQSESQTSEEAQPKKKTAAERIQEVINSRKEADARAEAAERRSRELEERLSRLESSQRSPINNAERPDRSKFDSDDDFLDALAAWKVAAMKLEEQQERLKQEAQEVETAFLSRLDKTRKEIDDFDEVVSAATVNVPDFVIMAIKESEQGPLLTYYLAKHPDDARRIAAMRPYRAVKALAELEAELSADPSPAPISKPVPKRAPDPITPVKGSTSHNPGPAPDFASYRERRKAELAKR